MIGVVPANMKQFGTNQPNFCIFIQIFIVDIHHTEQENRGSFYIKEGYEVLAQMIYSLGEGILVIEHTEVDDRLQGQQAGKKMLDRAVDLARAQKRRIVPLCVFAKALIEKKHNEYKDVL